MYKKINWKDKPDTSTPVVAANLNHMDDEIYRLSGLAGDNPVAIGDGTFSGAVNRLNQALNDGSVGKIGSRDVGSGKKIMYLKAGVPTASSDSIGSGTKMIYMDSGELKQSAASVGSGTKLIYMSAGSIVESGSDVGSGAKPVYLSKGSLVASNANIGANNKHIYMQDGELKASDWSIGSGIQPIYLENGMYKKSTANIGGSANLIYLSDGEFRASSAYVGSDNKPVFMQEGTIKACSANKGSASVPVYMRAGAIEECSTTSSYTEGGSKLFLASGAKAMNDAINVAINSVANTAGTAREMAGSPVRMLSVSKYYTIPANGSVYVESGAMSIPSGYTINGSIATASCDNGSGGHGVSSVNVYQLVASGNNVYGYVKNAAASEAYIRITFVAMAYRA